MKRFLNILLVLTCVIACAALMTSCMSSGTTCAAHLDMDSNGSCDDCGAAYTCPGHTDVDGDGSCDQCWAPFTCYFHIDEDQDAKCDKCKAPFVCAEHYDSDEDGFCDNCEAEYVCPGHCDVDRNNVCDECLAAYTCPGHTDADKDSICDTCKTPWACDGHVDADANNKCDKCKASFTHNPHKDADGDGKCDSCLAAYVCPGHKDANGDNKCDVCDGFYKAPVDYRSEFTAAVAATKPGVLVISVSTSEIGMPDLTSVYTVTYAEDGSFTVKINEQRYNSDLTDADQVINLPEVIVSCDANGNYSDGGEFAGSAPVTGLKVNFANLKTYSTPNANTLTASVAAADTSAVFGSALGADASLTVNKDANAITYVAIAYANVRITCVYN